MLVMVSEFPHFIIAASALYVANIKRVSKVKPGYEECLARVGSDSYYHVYCPQIETTLSSVSLIQKISYGT